MIHDIYDKRLDHTMNLVGWGECIVRKQIGHWLRGWLVEW